MKVLHVIPNNWMPRIGKYWGSVTMLVDEQIAQQRILGHSATIATKDTSGNLLDFDIVQIYHSTDIKWTQKKHPHVVYMLMIPYGGTAKNTIYPTEYIRNKLKGEGPVIPFGVDPKRFSYSEDKGDKFLFLGTLSAKKGLTNIIRVVKKSGTKLDICGLPHPPYEYLIDIARQCDGNVVLIGEVNNDIKRDLLSKAKGVLIWCCEELHYEAFCLTQIEAALSGTPVIALGEVCCETTTNNGFVVDTEEQYLTAINNIGTISPNICMERGLQYTSEIMAKRYIDYYLQLLSN